MKIDIRRGLLQWIIRVVLLLCGTAVGYITVARNIHGILLGILFGAIAVCVEIIILKIRLDTLFVAIIGGILGLILYHGIDYLIYTIFGEQIYFEVRRYSILLNVIFIYLGVTVAVNKKRELELLDKELLPQSLRKKAEELVIMDTSSIIDGRIVDMVKTHFFDNYTFIIPSFVLQELQQLADSNDSVVHNRGRRGLEILSKLQEMPNVVVKIITKDYFEIKEVDLKLIELAKEYKAKLMTTDYNLNKIATLQNIQVLNINELALAMKPVVLPGEPLEVFIVKEGKEREQGVGYLEDGTMIVVENGERYIGKRVNTVVVSIIQTSAGRMIFTRIPTNKDHRRAP
jgi:uncharacterized protein YacL